MRERERQRERGGRVGGREGSREEKERSKQASQPATDREEETGPSNYILRMLVSRGCVEPPGQTGSQ